MKVLIVDDAKIARSTVRKILEKAGHTVVGEASDGNIGLLKYKELNPDLVISDIEMADMDGILFLKAVREYDNNARVLMCSSLDQRAIVVTALELGAAGYVTKPLDEEILTKKLKKIESKM